MGFWNTGGWNVEGKNRVYVKLAWTKKGENPYFVFKDWDVKTTGNYFSGILMSIKFDTWEYDGNVIPKTIYTFDDWDNELVRDCTWNKLTRTFANCLIWQSAEWEIGKVYIVVWTSKATGNTYIVAKEASDSKENFKWGYSPEEFNQWKEVIESKQGKYISTDFTEHHNKLVEGLNKVKFKDPVAQWMNMDIKKETFIDSPDDDLPF